MTLLALIVGLSIGAGPPETPAGTPSEGERACVPLGSDETIEVDFADAPLSDVARLVSCALEKNLLFQPGTLGDRRVTVIGVKPIGRRGLAELWHALLADQGLVEERRGEYWLIRPNHGGRPQGPPLQRW